MKKLYQLIEEKRKEKGLSIRQLCQIHDLSPQTYIKMRLGKSEPLGITLLKFCDAAGIEDIKNIKQYVT